MAENITIEVLGEDDRPVRGAKVDVDVEGSMFAEGVGGNLKTAFTDHNGHAYFTTQCDYPDSAKIKIFVNGRFVEEERIGGGTFTVHLS